MVLNLNPMRNQGSHKDRHMERFVWLGNVAACQCPAQLFTIWGSQLGRDVPSNDHHGRWPLTTTYESSQWSCSPIPDPQRPWRSRYVLSFYVAGFKADSLCSSHNVKFLEIQKELWSHASLKALLAGKTNPLLNDKDCVSPSKHMHIRFPHPPNLTSQIEGSDSTQVAVVTHPLTRVTQGFHQGWKEGQYGLTELTANCCKGIVRKKLLQTSRGFWSGYSTEEKWLYLL